MRLPYLQVSNELLEHAASDLSVMLDWSEGEAGWGLLQLIRWGLGRCPDHLPPSASAVVRGPAAKLIAKAGGWTGDPERYIDALASLPEPILERVEDGVRIRGLSRYDSAWGKNHPKEWAEWKRRNEPEPEPKQTRNESVTKPGRSRNESGPQDADADADASLLPSEAGATANGSPDAVGLLKLAVQEADPPKPKAKKRKPPSLQARWFESIQDRRDEATRKAGLTLPRETWSEGIWVRVTAALQEHGERRMSAAYGVFLADSWASERDPPWPIGAFIGGDQLAKYLSQVDRPPQHNGRGPQPVPDHSHIEPGQDLTDEIRKALHGPRG